MNIGDGVYFGDSIWVIHAITNGRVYIRPQRQDEVMTNIPYYLATHNNDGSQHVSLALCEVNPEKPPVALAHARKHARKQPSGQQLSLFSVE